MSGFPRTSIGGLSVSRMIIGSNWFLGFSHCSVAKDKIINDALGDYRKVADIMEVFLKEGVDTFIWCGGESKTIMAADVFINLPKLKTHKKVGVTLNLKNLVGINGNKNWLPNHREGTPAQGGDQFADNGMIHRIERKAMACFRSLFPLFGPFRRIMARPLQALGKKIFGDTNKNTIRSGNWYGNDTTWRMVIDLNRILMYADTNGCLRDKPKRRIFCIVDGIVGGEGNGPLDPTPKPAGIVLAGTNPVAVDLVCARLMGFDYKRLPVLCEAMVKHLLPISASEYEEVICKLKDQQFDRSLDEFDEISIAFKPHFGWQGHVELNGK